MKALLVWAGTLAATSGAGGTALAQEHGVPAASRGLVVFQPVHADLTVIGWDRDSVRVTVANASAIRVELQPVAGGVQVVERRPLSAAAVRPAYTLFVPVRATVRVSLQMGALRVRGLQGTLWGRVIDGSIRADSLSGRAELYTVTGPLELHGGRGEIEARSVSGAVSLLGVSGSLRARTTSGDLRLSLTGRSTVTADSYSGTIVLHGPLGGGASSLATHSGDIELRLPKPGAVTLFLTFMQRRPVIECGGDTRLPAAGAPFPLGSGGDPVEIVTFSGRIRVRCDDSRAGPF